MTIIFANTISVKNCRGTLFFLFDILISKNKGKYSTIGGGGGCSRRGNKKTHQILGLFKGGCSDRGMVAVPVACHCMLHYMVNFLGGFSI